jgi:hypothetical protein
MTILLPDTSEFQAGSTTPDWAGIKSKNGGAGIIRVGYGDSHLDRMFVGNYTAMKKNGFKFMGLYQYLRAGQDPQAQARAFCTWVGPKSAVAPGTVFILDLEEGDGNQAGRAQAWHSFVDDFYGLSGLPLNKRSWLYSYTSFVTQHNLGAIFASARHTWIAAYQNTEPSIGHILWQSTDGKLGSNITNWPGCGRCDTSVHNGTITSLSADAWQVGSAIPDPPSAPGAFHGEYVTAGMSPLVDIAAKLKVPVNSLLRMTAVHYGTFGDDLGAWISDVLTGAKPFSTPVPKGVRLWVD